MKQILKLTFYSLVLFFSFNLYAQKADSIDFKLQVERVSKDSTSSFFYHKLQEKIKNKPGEISVEDSFYLYYGQIFQDNHKPLSFVANPERLDFDRAIMNGNCKKAVELGEKILNRNPVDLTVLLHVSNCITRSGYVDTTHYYEQRLNNLLDAIFSTGDGNTMSSAIKIVNMEDDYVLKGVLGFFGGNEQLSFDNNHAYSVWSKGGHKLYFEDVMNIK
ncbi:DUF4919 domain-containing protein [Pontibacter pamirensis]|uniref:DUF4919 domain-containing protein n=1 Tax=Pontibacter pamirensis TaxID=2562824 RepID=UPI001389C903|nr:DUF4919 domain-containing protein [Pontibacter pamirensis]